jgi:hypothetical protein
MLLLRDIFLGDQGLRLTVEEQHTFLGIDTDMSSIVLTCFQRRVVAKTSSTCHAIRPG